MFYTVALFAGAAALASAQLTFNSTTGLYNCPANNPNAAFCAGDSLSTNIIIRCTNGVGQPGNCNDNLAGYFPMGVNYAPCWQSSVTSGDAACSKNCIVEGSSGNYNGTFTLPNCTPQASTTGSGSSTAAPTSQASSSSVTVTSTGTTTYSVGSTTVVQTFTTTYCPASSTSVAPPPVSYTSLPFSSYTVIPPPMSTGTGSGGSGSVPSNGTYTSSSGAGSNPGSATATPVGPSQTTVPFNSGGIANAAAPGLAAVGLFFAYYL